MASRNAPARISRQRPYSPAPDSGTRRRKPMIGFWSGLLIVAGLLTALSAILLI